MGINIKIIYKTYSCIIYLNFIITVNFDRTEMFSCQKAIFVFIIKFYILYDTKIEFNMIDFDKHRNIPAKLKYSILYIYGEKY